MNVAVLAASTFTYAEGQVVHVEAIPGVVTANAAWMLDTVACARYGNDRRATCDGIGAA
jgi:hypothetical protein